ncbi:MAG TPA: 2'-5' RNA ligase family protein [Planctomycetota bacterium]|nr:2'-5' RNA ligase family protein [Planctomycetota bacterium]
MAELPSIESVRASYDPLAGKIAPHVTLVFPFDSPLSPEELVAHVIRVAEATEPFELSLGPPQAEAHGYVWLPVVEGRKQVVCIHDRLYTGILREFLSTEHAYSPHLTVAHVSEQRLADAFREAQTLKGPHVARIDRVVIERISKNETSEVESVIMLGQK